MHNILPSVESVRSLFTIPPHPHRPPLRESRKTAIKSCIKRLLKERHAILVAHYYTDGDIQELAEETGGCVADSLEMARFGSKQDAEALVVCGVRFMGETAKILNPEKRVLMPDLNATCSLDEGCAVNEFSRFRDQHPDRTIVVYANTSAKIKALADWVVTSSIALPVVRYLAGKGEKILWAPDRHLGRYVREQTGADMLLWNGSCVVHEEFKSTALQRIRRLHPGAAVLVHPESPSTVIEQADVVGSTTTLINAVFTMENRTFIVATDAGIFHQMKGLAPNKRLIEAPTAGEGATCESCGHCPWMAMNSLSSLANTLVTGANEITIETDILEKAVIPIRRMIAFTGR